MVFKRCSVCSNGPKVYPLHLKPQPTWTTDTRHHGSMLVKSESTIRMMQLASTLLICSLRLLSLADRSNGYCVQRCSSACCSFYLSFCCFPAILLCHQQEDREFPPTEYFFHRLQTGKCGKNWVSAELLNICFNEQSNWFCWWSNRWLYFACSPMFAWVSPGTLFSSHSPKTCRQLVGLG